MTSKSTSVTSRVDESTRPPLIPKEILFGNPDKVSPRISPDGTMVAYLAPHNGVLNVWVQDWQKQEARPVTEDKESGIQGYFWHYDNRHIMYIQDREGDENWLLYWVDITTLATKCLTNFQTEDLTTTEGDSSPFQVQIIDRNKDQPNDLLLAINKDQPELHDVYHLNLATFELVLRERNPGNFTDWIADDKLNIRGAMVARQDGGFDFLVRESEESEWDAFWTWDSDDSANSGPLMFTKDGQSVYLLDSTGCNATRLIVVSLDRRHEEVIFEDPEGRYDVSWALTHPDTLEIQLVALTKDRDEVVLLDKSLEEDLAFIQATHPGDFFFCNRNLDNTIWLIGFTTDDGPVPFYYLDRAKKKIQLMFEHQPALREYTLARMVPFAFFARDGLEIHGYLTFPPGLGKEKLPTLLNVHGGPWSRDYWGFDGEAQMIANRGYLCIQVNFRGSTGYGKDFTNAGNREWGGKMQDDLVDAVQWVISQGFTDPDRVGIYGGSYGGYAALVGAAMNSDVFCCAVDVVGMSNLLTFIESIPPYWKPYLEMLHNRVGNPETDEEFLRSRSPINFVDKIQIPLLIAQGANDPRVNKNESEQIVEALKEKGLDYEYLLFEDEGHGFVKPENRLRFYQAMEAFLAKHLGGRQEL